MSNLAEPKKFLAKWGFGEKTRGCVVIHMDSDGQIELCIQGTVHDAVIMKWSLECALNNHNTCEKKK